ncbi:sensor histidine kinase [Microbacterium azadirachtae]|uniref:sensor histidine kinase n=1 Tax=Microbacterium azadirachtae TaxID=582680 RepID=UPI0008927928|nr:sensor histidine kinase [Microbacterium azadirachtae]SDL70352.1 Histidine kinase-, DNA gyrase B-, and HSP90-like ATPase [Microbacterium azadirachtae]SEG00032.1 Histidine kinase-, DNA gyrase B-, and HSP90-like ATPase [Microbacterium azadirachtae]SEG02275.1 Histidine kinase-, DNA gyrase B-, and HSP90-like ATPase [Microbacterium azadirachtae]
MVDTRWRTVLAVAPYLVLGLLVAFELLTQWGRPERLLPTLALCAAYGLWVLTMRTLPFPWRDQPAAVAVFLTGAIVLNLVLVLREGTFGFLAIATFSFAYSLASWPWELLPVAGTAVVAGLAQSSGFGADPAGAAGTVAVILLNTVVMCGLSFGLHRAEQNLHRTAVQDERTRLAREIHDTLAQGFTGIITQLQAAEQAPDEPTRRRHADAALSLAREGLAEARRSVQALRPTVLEQTSLADALGGVARSWSSRTGIASTVTVSGTARPLPTETEVALLRTAQEALANVERHAAARRVAVVLRLGEDRVRLEVRDDGRGFDAVDRVQRASAEAGGYGLIAMRERLESAAGSLEVVSRPGRGTVVRAEVRA